MIILPQTIIDWDLSTNGYIKFFNSLLIQWGYYSGGEHRPSINFPVAFKNTPLMTLACIHSSSVNRDFAISQTDTTNEIVVIQQIAYNSTTQTSPFYWLSIGV